MFLCYVFVVFPITLVSNSNAHYQQAFGLQQKATDIKIISIWRENIRRDLSAEIICSEKRIVS